MGVETVSKEFRKEDSSHYEGLEYDSASGKIHHEMNPNENYILAEFRIPALRKQMPEEDYNLIADTAGYQCMHGMRFKKVTNREFHHFMHRESPGTGKKLFSSETGHHYNSYRDRDYIDVVRHKDEGKVITYYNSNSRTLGFLRHDYYMALLMYAGYPERDYIRRTPCKRLSPDCENCIETLQAEVQGWLDDPEPYKPTIDDGFFSFIEDMHHLCMGYTVDYIVSGDTCYKAIEPEYYILDLNVQYFRDAIYSKKRWVDEIFFNRKNCGELYSIGGMVENYSKQDLPYKDGNWRGYSSPVPTVVYDMKNRDTVPADIFLSFSEKDIAALWHADAIRTNARNTIHKYLFNGWIDVGNRASDGWFCGWNTSETIGANTAGFGAAGQAVAGQLTQVANMFGWKEGSGSTDTIYHHLLPIVPGHDLEDYVEPIPVRE